MINLNFIGHMGKDAELKFSKDGNSFYVFSVAVNKSKTDTLWIDVMLSKDRGDKISTRLVKGTKIYISGTPSLSCYENKAKLSVSAAVLEILTDVEQKPASEQYKYKDNNSSIPF